MFSYYKKYVKNSINIVGIHIIYDIIKKIETYTDGKYPPVCLVTIIFLSFRKEF